MIIMVYLFRRFVAFYLDCIVVNIISYIVSFFVCIFKGVSVLEIITNTNYMLVIFSLVIFIYFCFCDFLFNRTFGKTILKFKIEGYEDVRGMERLKQVLIRNLVRLIPIEPFSIFLNEEHRMWHDLASKTTVIDARKKSKV